MNVNAVVKREREGGVLGVKEMEPNQKENNIQVGAVLPIKQLIY